MAQGESPLILPSLFEYGRFNMHAIEMAPIPRGTAQFTESLFLGTSACKGMRMKDYYPVEAEVGSFLYKSQCCIFYSCCLSV